MLSQTLYRNKYPLLLFLAVLLIYLPFLGNDFVFDDVHSVSDQFLSYFGWPHLTPRWLPWATFSWTAAIFTNVLPHAFHLGNCILHGINTILIFFLVRQLLNLIQVESQDHVEEHDSLAFIGALIFACHPVAVYAVGYISQRTILMATLFGLVMQLAFLRAFLYGEIRWLIFSVMSYFIAIFCKEHSIMLPAITLAMATLLWDRRKLDLKLLASGLVASGLIALYLLIKVSGLLAQSYEPMAQHATAQIAVSDNHQALYLRSVLTQAGLFFKYLTLWVFPNPAWMSADIRVPLVSSIASWQGIGGAGLFLLYGIMAIVLLLKRGLSGLLGFALLYPWLHYLVEFSSVRVQEPFVLYRSYLWMTGWGIVISLAFHSLKVPARKILLVTIIILFTLVSWNRLHTLSSNYLLWDDAAKLISENTAGADRIYFNRGQAAAKLHDWDTAIKDLRRVTRLSPELLIARLELGMAYLNVKKYDMAIAEFEKGIAIDPTNAELHLGMGLALIGAGDKTDGQNAINHACALGNPTACFLSIAPKQKIDSSPP